MNYAEQCRAIAKPYREAGRSWADPKHDIAKEQIKLAALLDAAAGLYEAGCNVSNTDSCYFPIGAAIDVADAAAKGAE